MPNEATTVRVYVPGATEGDTSELVHECVPVCV